MHAPGTWLLGEEHGVLGLCEPDREPADHQANWTAGLRLRHPLRRA